MNLFEGKTPAERNKLIAAIVLGVIAFISLSYMLFGSSSGPTKTTRNTNNRASTSQLTNTPTTPIPSPSVVRNQQENYVPQPIQANWTQPSVPEAGRNIFAFYEKPKPPPPTPTLEPTPVPTPSPPLILASVSPSNVFARTGDFKLEVSGEKFTIASHIFIDDVELPTRYVSPQQLTANVPAALIGGQGTRQIVVRTPDGQLYSNPLTLNVSAPPTPNYTYVGIIGRTHYNDTAVVKDNGTRQLLNVQRGDILGGRFRVTSISDREIALIDTTLHVKHTLPFTSDKSAGAGGPMTGGNPTMPTVPMQPQTEMPEEEPPPEEEPAAPEEENP